MKKYILIVDDDPAWLVRMREEIAPLNFEVLEADGYHQAERLVEIHESELALVISDNHMPIGDRMFSNLGLDLRELMHLLSDTQASIPFILFTSELSEEQRERAARVHAATVIKRHNVQGELLYCARNLLGV